MSKLTYPVKYSENGLALVSLPNSVYSAEAIRQSAYKFSGDYFVIAQVNEDSLDVTFEKKDGTPISEIQIKEICNDFVDQQIRIDTEKEYGHIRDLIVEEAFKPVNR